MKYYKLNRMELNKVPCALEDRMLRQQPSPEHDIANAKTLASKIPSADIAAKLGQSLEAPAVTAHHPKSLLKVKAEDSRGIPSSPDPGPAGFDWPNE
jgi:hypothetical protein